MCRQGVFVENPHNFPQFPTLEGDLDPSHPQYAQIASQRRQIRKWNIKNRRMNITKPVQVQKTDDNLSKKELRRIKNRESAAESRKRKIAEIEGARETIGKLNQENVLLRQRLLELEQTVKSFKYHPDQSVHSQPSFIKSELTPYVQPQASFHQQYEQQQSFDVKKHERYAAFDFGTADLSVQQTSFDMVDPFGFEFNADELSEFLGSNQYDFANW